MEFVKVGSLSDLDIEYLKIDESRIWRCTSNTNLRENGFNGRLLPPQIQASVLESKTLSEELQPECDRKTMGLCKRHYRHCIGVREWYLRQSDFKDHSRKWWWAAWVVEYFMEALEEMYREAAMRQDEPSRLTPSLDPQNITLTCAGCMKTVTLAFNGDVTVGDCDHTSCTSPLANELQNKIVASLSSEVGAAEDGAVDGIGTGVSEGHQRGRRSQHAGTVTNKPEAIRQAFRMFPHCSVSVVATKATRLYKSDASEGSGDVSAAEVAEELERIKNIAVEHRTPEELDVYETWVEGRTKVTLVKKWSDQDIEVTAYHDSTNLNIMLIIRVHAPSINSYAHAVLVPDATAKKIPSAAGVTKARRGTSYKDQATRVYGALSLIDGTTPMEGYELLIGDERVSIGCAKVDFEQAGDTKGGHRVCLKKAAQSLKSAIAAVEHPREQIKTPSKRPRNDESRDDMNID